MRGAGTREDARDREGGHPDGRTPVRGDTTPRHGPPPIGVPDPATTDQAPDGRWKEREVKVLLVKTTQAAPRVPKESP